MPNGRIRWYDAKKGYGFIADDDGKDVFLPSAAVPYDVKNLRKGTRVEFSVVEGRKGPQAMGLTVLASAPSLVKATRPKAEDMAAIVEDLIKLLDSASNGLRRKHYPSTAESKKLATLLRAVADNFDVQDQFMSVDVLDPKELAYKVALESSECANAVGNFVSAIDLGDNVTDFRFESTMRGYEGWQWSVTLYHDEELDKWTVNESTLIPTDDSLLPPKWIPWKDRLQPSDLSVTDSIGTPEDDSRLENGLSIEDIESNDEFKREYNIESKSENDSDNSNISSIDSNCENVESRGVNSEDNAEDNAEDNHSDESSSENSESSENSGSENIDNSENSNACEKSVTSLEDIEDAIKTFHLSRRKVMTPEAIAQTAKRWYSGQHGPKSLSTRIADGSACSTCGFMIPLAGALGNMFGVCANAWSPDDGKVVALNHGCGEHSDIEPPEPSQLWIQSDPAYDDYHIDVIEQSEREERADVELIEEAIEDSKENKRIRRKASSKH